MWFIPIIDTSVPPITYYRTDYFNSLRADAPRMPRQRFGGVRISDDEDTPFDVEFAIEVEGDDEDVVNKVAREAREHGVRALQALATGKHPDKCDGVPVSNDWERILSDADPKGPTDENGASDQ